MRSIADAMGSSPDKAAPEAADKGASASPMQDHLRKMRDEMGGKHMHVQSNDEGGYTSHQIGDGEPEGPHDHENIDRLKEHMDKFLDEEAAEGNDSDGPDDDGLM